MLVLKEYEVCPHRNNCPHNQMNECYGAKHKRENQFTCIFVKNGEISEDGFRLPNDKTGKMKIILE